MEIDQLPDYIDVMLSENEAIPFPLDGEIVTTHQVRVYCFSAKQFLSTWSLRSRIMECHAKIASQFSQLNAANTHNNDDDDTDSSSMSGEQFQKLMLMSGFDLEAALNDFINIAIVGKLCELDDGIHINKERWGKVTDTAKEKIFFAFAAAFIMPCVM